MNKFQEISAGLVLLFGGDSPAAIRAGDALLADRIDEAVVEGGFTAISYGSWKKAPESAVSLRFEGIRLERGAGAVRVSDSLMNVFSHALAFTGGEFTWSEGAQDWRFDSVSIEPRGLFDQVLQITASGLEPTPPAAADCRQADALRCALASIGAAPVDRFGMVFRSRDRLGVVTLGWEAQDLCYLAWSADGYGAASLADWGRDYLREPARIEFTLSTVSCEVLVGEDGRLDGEVMRAAAAERATVDGQLVMDAAPVLIGTLFGLVAESYAYLLE